MKYRAYPSLKSRILSVWQRYYRVYTKNLISNGFPTFMEPLIFLGAIGIGMGRYIDSMGGVPYVEFLASGLIVTAAMYTAAFECTYGTFVRIEYEKIYDGMLASPISVSNLFMGEMLWAGTKGIFFSLVVAIIVSLLGILSPISLLAAAIGGFLTALMFSAFSLIVTSFVKDMNQFNFYHTGLLSPMFFFSGAIFTLDGLPGWTRLISEALPLTRSVRLVRAVIFGGGYFAVGDIMYMLLFISLAGFIAIERMKKKLLY